ncbi:MAG: secondary thiamine-phosphate synthase enzyme YjbQ [Thermofilum sp.]|uniref:YjbQ family protein n=1 Tax=Thermofilum pendens TaxID=2269 RepID=A0A7C4D590_THEPE
MRTHVKVLELRTSERFQLVDITRDVEKVVQESEVKNGICVVHAPHATAAVILNEHESGLIRDILNKLRELFPPDAEYMHNRIDDNAHAHIASALLGSSKVLPVVNSRLVRGTWQNIFLVELDGPRNRREVVVQVLGE